jgi:hypothetical protein
MTRSETANDALMAEKMRSETANDALIGGEDTIRSGE